VTRRKAVMVDIDGTLTLKGDRDPYKLDTVGEDHPNTPVIEVVRATRAAGYDTLLCSGRRETSRVQTAVWSKFHYGEFEALFMRGQWDGRPDHEVKLDLYRERIEPYWDVLCVFDDRSSVVQAWRSIGLTVMQVAPGDF
jgi:hypothetical protein